MDNRQNLISGLMSSLVDKQYACIDDLLSPEALIELNELITNLKDQGEFRPATIGKGNEQAHTPTQRGDLIHWIENWNTCPPLARFAEFLEVFMLACRKDLYLPVKHYESHFAVYPKNAFYKKHLDQHRGSPHRQISLVLYLSDWAQGDGGELVLYPENQERIMISPRLGRLVCFLSAGLPHEVLPCQKERRSLTTWLRSDLPRAGY